LYVDNNTGYPITANCTGWVSLGLTNSHIAPNVPATPSILCPRVAIQIGHAEVPVTIGTAYYGCTQQRGATSSLPRCAPNGKMPDLPIGAYRTVALLRVPDGIQVQKPPPINVTLLA
jgi:hypothetical protein